MTPEHDRARAAAADTAHPDTAHSGTINHVGPDPDPWPITRRPPTPATTPTVIIGGRTPAPDLAWIDDANCNGQTDLMFPHNKAGTEIAKRICDGCPVFDPCKAYAAHIRPSDGVWAGVTHTYHHSATRQDSQPRTPIAHGTPKGWKKHYDYPHLFGPACVACSQAHSKSTMARKQAARTQKEGATECA